VHWHTHLLERVAVILLSLTLGAVHAGLMGESGRSPRRLGARLYGLSVVVFLLATVLFGPNLHPFLNGIYIGHQARELLTHSLVTLPLSFGAGLLVLRNLSGARAAVHPHGSLARVPPTAWLAGLGAVLMGVYLAVGFFATAAYGRGQTNSMVALVLVHFYEHGLTFVFTPLWTAFLCAWLATKSDGSSGAATA
jgi:hypothetical protein